MDNVELPVIRVAEVIKHRQLHEGRAAVPGGHIGPSDVGGCRKRAVYSKVGADKVEPDYWLGAAMGTAWHAYLEELVASMVYNSYDDLTPSAWVTEHEMNITLGSQTIHGTADLIVPELNLVIDWKTSGNVEWVKKFGINEQQALQGTCYAIGAAQEGLIELDKATVMIVHWDRSASQQEPIIHFFPVTQELMDDAVDWVASVTDTSDPESLPREAPPSFCYNLCQFVDVCRGQHEDEIDDAQDPEIVEAVNVIQEQKAIVKEANAVKKEAEKKLDHFHGGVVGDTKVGWVRVEAKTIQSYERAAYSRLQLTKIRRKK